MHTVFLMDELDAFDGPAWAELMSLCLNVTLLFTGPLDLTVCFILTITADSSDLSVGNNFDKSEMFSKT